MKKRVKRHVNVESKIYNVISSNTERWSSIGDISAKTGLTSNDVFRVINESDGFVLSSNSNQQPVITTRKRFRKEEPFLTKLIGAFKNRID